jgi:hypothetical protein
VLPYIVELTDMHPCIGAYQVVVNFCEEQDVPVINAFHYFRGLKARELWINAFDGHPNVDGHLLIAKAAEDLIKNSQLIE